MSHFDKILNIYDKNLEKVDRAGFAVILVDLDDKDITLPELMCLTDEERKNRPLLIKVEVNLHKSYWGVHDIEFNDICKYDEDGEPLLDEDGEYVTEDMFEYQAVQDAVHLIYARCMADYQHKLNL